MNRVQAPSAPTAESSAGDISKMAGTFAASSHPAHASTRAVWTPGEVRALTKSIATELQRLPAGERAGFLNRIHNDVQNVSRDIDKWGRGNLVEARREAARLNAYVGWAREHVGAGPPAAGGSAPAVAPPRGDPVAESQYMVRSAAQTYAAMHVERGEFSIARALQEPPEPRR